MALDCYSNSLSYLLIIGFFGSGIPAFLFPMAQTKISSILAGMLNSLSPVFTLIIGILFYDRKAIRSQIIGVFLGLLGAVGLLYAGSFSFNYYGLLIILATILYGISSNEVSVVALALFYLLIRDTSPVFGSTVTYFVPIISTLWGLADNESLMPSMFISIVVILTGVYIINRAALKKYIRSLNE